MQTLDALEGDCLVAQRCFLLLVYFLEELLLKLLWRLEDSEVCYHLRMMVLLILVLRFVTARDSRYKGLVTFEGWIGASCSSGMSSSCCDVSTWSP